MSESYIQYAERNPCGKKISMVAVIGNVIASNLSSSYPDEERLEKRVGG
jgi:hypothetical protein